jgi:hypothetical protein
MLQSVKEIALRHGKRTILNETEFQGLSITGETYCDGEGWGHGQVHCSQNNDKARTIEITLPPMLTPCTAMDNW